MHYLLGQLDIVPSFCTHVFIIWYIYIERENLIIIYMTPEEDHRVELLETEIICSVFSPLVWEERERGRVLFTGLQTRIDHTGLQSCDLNCGNGYWPLDDWSRAPWSLPPAPEVLPKVSTCSCTCQKHGWSTWWFSCGNCKDIICEKYLSFWGIGYGRFAIPVRACTCVITNPFFYTWL